MGSSQSSNRIHVEPRYIPLPCNREFETRVLALRSGLKAHQQVCNKLNGAGMVCPSNQYDAWQLANQNKLLTPPPNIPFLK
jgi:hypothetical protein